MVVLFEYEIGLKKLIFEYKNGEKLTFNFKRNTWGLIEQMGKNTFSYLDNGIEITNEEGYKFLLKKNDNYLEGNLKLNDRLHYEFSETYAGYTFYSQESEFYECKSTTQIFHGDKNKGEKYILEYFLEDSGKIYRFTETYLANGSVNIEKIIVSSPLKKNQPSILDSTFYSFKKAIEDPLKVKVLSLTNNGPISSEIRKFKNLETF